jgi:DNA-directed RNA polymerase specialized sigma24 family protein
MLVELSTDLKVAYLTDLEIKSLIQGLTLADILRLGQIAKKYARRCLMDADELLNAAIVVIASGTRKFPRNVPLLAVMAETMKSIAYNEKRKANRKFSPIDDDPILNIVDENIHIENEISDNQELNDIYKLFENDGDVTLLLMAKYDGLNPDEICEMENWDRKKYNSVLKRLRRGLNQRFPNGRET